MASRRGASCLAVIGLVLILAGAASQQLRLDAPEFALTPVHPIVEIRLEDAPTSAGRTRFFDAVLLNTGRYPISIKGVRSTCGCTIPSGGVSNGPVSPGERIEFPVTVTLPAYGKKEAEMFVETNVEELAPARIKVRMAGRALTPPYINSNPQPIQLSVSHPGDLVQHLLIVTTVEAAGTEPWVTGLSAHGHPANVELIDVSTTREVSGGEIIERRYEFMFRCEGPVDRSDVVAFELLPETDCPSTKPIDPRTIRIRLTTRS